MVARLAVLGTGEAATIDLSIADAALQARIGRGVAVEAVGIVAGIASAKFKLVCGIAEITCHVLNGLALFAAWGTFSAGVSIEIS